MNKGKNFLQKEFTGLGLVVLGIMCIVVVLIVALFYVFAKSKI